MRRLAKSARALMRPKSNSPKYCLARSGRAKCQMSLGLSMKYLDISVRGIIIPNLDNRAFHLEHIVTRQHGGETMLDNLAWACHRCNRHKGPNLTGIDPTTKEIVPLFHPRRLIWTGHFILRGIELMGLRPTGRATSALESRRYA